MPELTIYAVKPWSCDSKAVVAPEPDLIDPPEAKSIGAVYFIEVFLAKEFLENWLAAKGRPISTKDQCERLIQYAVNDA